MPKFSVLTNAEKSNVKMPYNEFHQNGTKNMAKRQKFISDPKYGFHYQFSYKSLSLNKFL